MSFIWPPMLLSIALVPLGVWLYARIGRNRRRRLVLAFGPGSILGFEAGGRAATARPDAGADAAGPRAARARAGGGRDTAAGRAARVPGALVLAGLVVMGVALARPQAVVALPRQQGTVILAFDVSGSMAAKDIAPTRIAAARAAAKDFVANQPSGIEIGVVAFSDSGTAVQAPTTDEATIDAAIDRLSPKKGTSVGAGITASLDAIAAAARGPYGNDYYTRATAAPTPTPSPTPVPAGYHAPAVVVLLTDGENNENPDPLAAAQVAAARGVRIFTVGIGSAGGADLDVNGVHVRTQLDAAQLQQIATLTGGTYYAASDASQLRSVYDHLDTQLVSPPELTELTSFFAGASLVLLFAGGMLSLLWLGRAP